uniref:Putative secreted protein n=1 Tax=Anopheles marajoara TaxID=58244 RepID=A0A2M4CBC9_9DIPT
MCCWFRRTRIRPQSVLSLLAALPRPPSPVRSFWDGQRQRRVLQVQQSLALHRLRRLHPHVYRNGSRNHNPHTHSSSSSSSNRR